jgi:hypothetical protein
VRVTAKNWQMVKGRVLEIERASFVPSIQENEDSLGEIALSPSSISLVAFVGEDTLVGYAMGDELSVSVTFPARRATPTMATGTRSMFRRWQWTQTGGDAALALSSSARLSDLRIVQVMQGSRLTFAVQRTWQIS